MTIRSLIRLPALRSIQLRNIVTTSIRHTTAGYGDPQSEKIENHTPTPKPSSASDPQPNGQGKGVGQQSGTTDPEIKPSGGGKSGKSEGQEDREIKKIGEEPKKDNPDGVVGG